MRKLTNNELLKIAGGTPQLLTVAKLSTDGLSKACINHVLVATQQLINNQISGDAYELSVLNVCSRAEYDLLEERLATTLPLKTELL